ncbi:Calcium-independent phospholipase A2-gamma [Zalerion maritima]|uniref:Calcium-independent phospholipase A2-gamma n=1 Tax=Zalerion maritima TaxID=339359 RepID=A0AAD5RXU7_9PEZI|nr:Calcium-independent phospholipase A2-gamma [Zalerion maritima]
MDIDSNGLKRKDTTKGPPLRILSLDGGGVRGYSMLIIIQELMHKTYVEVEGKAPRPNQIPKPCDHFDLIVGTGTGGLIALMLGRLRLDLETCKELYTRLTRMVFQTDKTIAGIPYRHTLFKASKLEEAIKDAVQEHTVVENEGNDGAPSPTMSPLSAAARSSAAASDSSVRRHSSNASVVSFSARSPQAQMTRPRPWNARLGNPNARLYDERENRTKTAVTAMYRGTPNGGKPAVLRSYDSRKETSPEYDCKIWEAGRATCAIGLAFKPIRVGQSIFHDDGAGTFNPAPYALDEAVVNEWPGRDVGVFVSVGTGKRPASTDSQQAQWYEGFLGEFADARRKLITKIEGCEKIHKKMMTEFLANRGVNAENYYRLNVEVGVGEFGMNEWHRLAEISTGTRRYLSRQLESKMCQDASTKLAKIHRAKLRWDRGLQVPPPLVHKPISDIDMPFAVELPGDMPMSPIQNHHNHLSSSNRTSFDSGPETLNVPLGNTSSPRSSGERLQPPPQNAQPRPSSSPRASAELPAPPREEQKDDPDRLVVAAPTPAQFRYTSNNQQQGPAGADNYTRRHQRIEPPPLPPKTPLPEKQAAAGRKPPQSYIPPYPLDDEAPPAVNMARKPDRRAR